MTTIGLKDVQEGTVLHPAQFMPMLSFSILIFTSEISPMDPTDQPEKTQIRGGHTKVKALRNDAKPHGPNLTCLMAQAAAGEKAQLFEPPKTGAPLSSGPKVENGQGLPSLLNKVTERVAIDAAESTSPLKKVSSRGKLPVPFRPTAQGLSS